MLRALIVAAVGAAVAATVVAVRAPASTPPGVIRITDKQVEFQRIRGAKNHTGDVEIVQQRLYNPSISKPIGRGDLVCTYLNRRLRQCTSTYTLPRGSIVVTGMIDSRLLYTAAIVGGTGLYDNARGTLTTTATHLSPRREVLVFRLTG